MMRSSFLLFVAMILVTSFGPLPDAYALSDIDGQKEQIRKRDRELLQLEKKRRNIAGDESIFIEELKELEHTLRTLDMKIYSHTQAIHLLKHRVSDFGEIARKSKKEIGRRMRTRYVKGDTYYLSQTMTVRDLFACLHKVYGIMKQDRRMMSQFKESHARLRVAGRELATQLRVLQQEKEHARKLLGTLQAQITKNKRNQFEITSRCTHLENENERAQTEAFNLVRGSIEKAREREIQQGTPTFTGELFYWPVDGGPITSSFGYRFDPVQKVNRLHRGLDIGGAFGTPIKAAADGRVIESRPSTGYGYIVVLHHGNGLSTLYAHMYGSTVTAKVGDFVHKGQVIARVGSNGWSTGPHLHFEVIEAGQAKNPITYFARKGRR